MLVADDEGIFSFLFKGAHGVYGYHTRLASDLVLREVPGSIPGVSNWFFDSKT